MNRLRPIDTTSQTVNAQLFFNETILQSQGGIGIYDGKNKDDRYQDGTLYLTSHRLIYVDRANPHRHSCFLDISLIRQTEYWIGFLKSSPKITLLLGTRRSGGTPNPQDSTLTDGQLKFPYDQNDILNHPAASHWTCHVCGFSNPPELKCGLCGIPRDLSSSSTSAKSASSSRPSSSLRHLSSLSGNLKPPPSHTRSLSNLRGTAKQAVTIETSSSLADECQRIQQATTKEIPCPSCTFLNHPSMARCEICDSILGTIQLESLILDDSLSESNMADSSQNDLQHSRATTPAPPASFPEDSYIRLSFRRGGDKTFYFSLKKALQGKSWNTTGLNVGLEFAQPSGTFEQQESSQITSQNDPQNVSRPIGIDRILKTMDSQQQAHRTELTEGLQDLQALMAKAKKMVQLSQSINAKLTSLESTPKTSDEADSPDQKAGLIRSSLVKLGLPAPAVTPDMISSDQAFARELAKELAGLLTRAMGGESGIMFHGFHDLAAGIRPLDEVWCIWNRARGISLVSPADMIAACHHLPEYTTPVIRLRTFKSGLRVLHTPYFSVQEFEKRLLGQLRNAGEHASQGDDGILHAACDPDDQPPTAPGSQRCRPWKWLPKVSTLEIAQAERLSVNLTTELIESIEQAPPDPSAGSEHCSIVRDFDPQTGLTFWFENRISDYHWEDSNSH